MRACLFIVVVAFDLHNFRINKQKKSNNFDDDDNDDDIDDNNKFQCDDNTSGLDAATNNQAINIISRNYEN